MSANLDIANVLLEQEDYQKALQIYLDILRENPNDGEIYQSIARCYYRLKKYDDAFSASKEAIRLDGNLSIPHILLAYINHNKGDLDSAIVEAEKAYNLSPELDEASNCYGALLLSSGMLDESIKILKNFGSPVFNGKLGQKRPKRVNERS